ncbi:hypothetical protein [Nocardioides sp. MH1]|uniref:hypothetical protein n=1 Tax=Nocardioides sp. MH1 TaxID=3242490 RepID=UPI00351F846F
MADTPPTPATRPTPEQVLAGDLEALEATTGARVRAAHAELTPAVAAKVASWAPNLTERSLSSRQWAAWAPLVRAAVTLTRPPTPTAAAALLGDALSLVAHAAARRTPLRLEFVFRDTTAAAYLTYVNPASAATIRGRLTTLVAAVADPTRHDPGPEDAALRDAAPPSATSTSTSTTIVTGTVVVTEPLLLDRPIDLAAVTTAGLDTPAGRVALEVLRSIRGQVRVVEPTAFTPTDRPRGRGRAVPYGDVEVTALLAAAASLRTTKRRLHTAAALCLGLGAGITGEPAARLRGSDIHTDADGVVVVTLDGRVVPVHAAFAPAVVAAAAAAGPGGWVIGGGTVRRTRMGDLAEGLATRDPHLVRLNSTRLTATWLCLHLTAGIPLRDLLEAGGWTSAEPLTAVLPYLPATTAGRRLLAGAANPAAAVAAEAVAGAAGVVAAADEDQQDHEHDDEQQHDEDVEHDGVDQQRGRVAS